MMFMHTLRTVHLGHPGTTPTAGQELQEQVQGARHKLPSRAVHSHISTRNGNVRNQAEDLPPSDFRSKADSEKPTPESAPGS
jgi:hypothetical protein